MSYDIALGRCVEVGTETVVVRIEGAMLVKLEPSFVFNGPAKALLRIARSVCSQTRPPKEGEEVFVDRDRLLLRPDAFLDMNGDGGYVPVDLNSLIVGLTPNPQPPDAKKPRAADYPNTLKRR
jgi:hypothetical protein